jgi:hypothetical protein
MDVMGRPAAQAEMSMRRFLVCAVVGAVTVAAGCDGRPPRAAAGFRRAGIAALRIGMPVDELTGTLGAPLSIDPGTSDAAERQYVYSVPGGADFEIFRHRIRTGTGAACVVTVRSGAVSEILVRARSTCRCARESCPQSWAAECMDDIPA